jgi:hypothetical protein
MFNIPFNEDLKIGEGLRWSSLKYGLCSYFALAYSNKYPSYNHFLAVMEYDEEVEKEYLVHFLVLKENKLIDAYGTWTNWEASVRDITDIKFMELTTKEVDKEFVLEVIEEDVGYDEKLYHTIKKFVDNAY